MLWLCNSVCGALIIVLTRSYVFFELVETFVYPEEKSAKWLSMWDFLFISKR